MLGGRILNISEERIGSYPYVKIEGVKHFEIRKIFDCGQCFRFEPVESGSHECEFSGVAYGKFVSFAQDGDTVFIYGSSIEDFESIWRKYLDIDRDYEEVADEILNSCSNPVLSRAVAYGDGIRILAQEPFECVISFIISQNNNIPRIKKIIEALSLKAGKPVEICPEAEKHLSGKSSLCVFPTAEALTALGVDGLFQLKTGFRARYIYDAAEQIRNGSISLEEIAAENDVEKAVEILCKIKGIGKKVASCALLFGFGKYDAFPIDVWMKRVAQKYFPDKADEMSGKTFGRYAGIAQQYLFYYERWINGGIN